MSQQHVTVAGSVAQAVEGAACIETVDTTDMLVFPQILHSTCCVVWQASACAPVKGTSMLPVEVSRNPLSRGILLDVDMSTRLLIVEDVTCVVRHKLT